MVTFWGWGSNERTNEHPALESRARQAGRQAGSQADRVSNQRVGKKEESKITGRRRIEEEEYQEERRFGRGYSNCLLFPILA